MAPSSGGRKRKRKPKPTQHKPEHQQTAHSSLREATLSRSTITTRGSSSSRSHRTAQGAAGVVAKQEAQQAVAEPAGPATKAAKRARRATTTTASVVASLEIVKKEEQEGEELGEAAATSPMRAPQAAAAAAAATVVTSFDFLPTLAPAGLFVGCSGCSYKQWHATPAQPRNFYPFPSAAREFAHYATHFNSLEINHTFYHLPSPETCARWRAQAPRPEFLYVLKAHRYFTHTKRIHVDEWFRRKWEEAFWPRCQELGPHLGPVLFQFPKGFQRNHTTLQRLDDLGSYLASQCPGGRFAIEFRHPSWFDEQGRREAYPLLHRHNLCLCGIHVTNPAADADPDDAEEEEDGTWGALRTGCHPPLSDYPHDGCEWGVYLRFHGNHSRGSYGAQALEAWAAAVWRWRREGLPPNGAASPRRQAFAFFNNDASMDDQGEPGLPSAVADAHQLGQLLARRLEAEPVATADDADGMGAGKGEGEGGIVVKGEQPS